MPPSPDIVPPSGPAAAGRRILPLILGMHRSGTSMTAGCLHRLGIDMVDDAVGAHETNRGGHYERVPFMVIHDRLLADLGSRWDGLAPLEPGWWRAPAAMVARRDIKARLRAALPEIGRRPWGIKDPRLMRLLPLWLDVCTDLDLEPRLLLVTRDPEAVARSLGRRNAMARDDALALWLAYHMEFVRNVGDLPWLRIDHRDWLADPHPQIQRMIDHFGLTDGASENAVAAIEAFVHAEWTDARASARPVPSAAQTLYERLVALADSGAAAPVACSPALRAAARDFSAFAQTFRGALARAERVQGAEPAGPAIEPAARPLPGAADAATAEAQARLERQVAELLVERDRAEAARAALAAELADARSIAIALRTSMIAFDTGTPAG